MIWEHSYICLIASIHYAIAIRIFLYYCKDHREKLVSFSSYTSFFSFFFTSTTFSFTCRTFFRLLFWIVCSAHNTAPHHIRRLSTKYEDVRFNWYGNRYLKQKERMKERTTDLSICIESSSCQMLLLNFILFFPVLAFPSCICKHYHKERIDLCSIDDKKEEGKKISEKEQWKKCTEKKVH